MNFLKLKAKNFLSYDKLEFEFKKGVHLVIGENRDSNIAESNGSGKSALFEAIIYVLFGKAFRDIKRRGSAGTGVALEFELNNNHYKFIRYYNHAKYGNRLFIFMNEEQKVFRTKEEQEIFLKRLLPISFKQFISSVIFVQGFPVRISTMSPSELKNFFLEFLNIDFDKILKQVKKDIQQLKYNYKTKLAEYQHILSKLNMVKGKIDLIKEELEKINIKELERLKSHFEEEFKKVDTEIKLIEAKIKKLVEEKATLENEYKRIQTLISQGKCPFCGSKISSEGLACHLKEIKDRLLLINNLLDEYNKEKETLVSSKYGYIDAIKDKQVKIQQYEEKLELLREFENNYQEWEQKAKELEKQINDLEYNLNLLEEFYSELLPSGSIRAFISKQFVDIYNKLLNNILQCLYSELANVKLVYRNNGIEIEGVNYKNLSGGEKRRLDFIFQLAFSDLVYYIFGFKSDLLVFDEIFDNLDLSSSIAIIDFVKSYFGDDKKIYFITHNNDLKTMFDSVIKVVKENGVSKLDLTNYRGV